MFCTHKQPNVQQFMHWLIALGEVCDLPFIEPEYSFIEEYGKKTLKALSKVDRPCLRDARNACMGRLRDGLAYARKEHAAGRWR